MSSVVKSRMIASSHSCSRISWAPFSLKTNGQKTAERKRMDFHFFNWIISLSLLFIIPMTSNLARNYYILQWIWGSALFIIITVLIISSWKFSIKLLVVMVKLKRWDYFIISIVTGSLTSFIFYFAVFCWLVILCCRIY